MVKLGSGQNHSHGVSMEEIDAVIGTVVQAVDSNPTMNAWYQRSELPCAMSIAHRLGHVELTSSGEALIRKHFAALANMLELSEREFVDTILDRTNDEEDDEVVITLSMEERQAIAREVQARMEGDDT